MCFDCLVIHEDAIHRGIPYKYTRYWACQKNVVITDKDRGITREITNQVCQICHRLIMSRRQEFNDRQRKRLEFMESVYMRPLSYDKELPFESFITNSVSNMPQVKHD